MPDNALRTLSEHVLEHLRRTGWRLVTVESCTGGLIAAALSDIPGSSDVLEGGFVTYSNALKMSAVSVPEAILAQYGAVSTQTAEAMARGGLLNTKDADLAISVTGIAGPGGGSTLKPVGTVCFGLAARTGSTTSVQCHFTGDRAAIRAQSVHHALQMVLNA
ncbi:CinA family protein [Gluconobacter sp. R75690]|uniref:CinA family protein n=1 Tax=Gluconobacter TaxID=441 RepID=UPI00188AB1A8|nr:MULTISPECIES: CinA family protein [unclassified Gluconobacter]MBF0852058.1 CinA family protein [Gluconobacter sp. R75690]MBF0880635.1 CinA family protein [Gluconobacter sp. R75828]